MYWGAARGRRPIRAAPPPSALAAAEGFAFHLSRLLITHLSLMGVPGWVVAAQMFDSKDFYPVSALEMSPATPRVSARHVPI